MSEIYYFGCANDRGGHYWWGEGWLQHREPAFASRRGYDGFPVDGIYPPPGKEIQCKATMHFVHGFTVLAWWDRSVDKRGACNSSLWVQGRATFGQILERGREAFPGLLERQEQPLGCPHAKRLFEDDAQFTRLLGGIKELVQEVGG